MSQKKKILHLAWTKNTVLQCKQLMEALPEYEHRFSPYFIDFGENISTALLGRAAGLMAVGFPHLLGRYAPKGLDQLLEHFRDGNYCVIAEPYIRNTTFPLFEEYGFDVDESLYDFAPLSNVFPKSWSDKYAKLCVTSGKPADDYALVVSAQDGVVPRSIRATKFLLLQEGMLWPDKPVLTKMSRWFPKHTVRAFGESGTHGLSGAYEKLCVASEGWKKWFVQVNKVPERKIEVTGMLNFDDCSGFRDNDLKHHGFTLCCTSNCRELGEPEDRTATIQEALRIADGGELVFKLHPSEYHERAIAEIKALAPQAKVYTNEFLAEELIANCGKFFTLYSSTLLVAMALGKEVYSPYIKTLAQRVSPMDVSSLCPDQHGSAAARIADVCRDLIEN